MTISGQASRSPDGGSGLNLIFASTLRKMGLDLTNMLVPSKSPFYGIIPGNAAHPLGMMVLPVTFGVRENYRTEFIKFEVANYRSVASSSGAGGSRAGVAETSSGSFNAKADAVLVKQNQLYHQTSRKRTEDTL
jgi:hypothetical protein